jgi:prevent-host-death family protein
VARRALTTRDELPPEAFVTILMTMSAKPSSRIVKAGEFKAKCLELMDEVAASGETIVVTKRGKPVAKLGPIDERPASLFGLLQGNFTFVGDVVSPVDVDWGPAEPAIRSRRAKKA